MKRVLLLYGRDWLNPESGAVEHYLHEVFARIVGYGHSVAWVAQNDPPWPFSRRTPAPRIEIVDGIKIARLGMRYFHRTMVGMLLHRLAQNGKFKRDFDAVIDCVTGYPMSVEQAPVPVVPLVFQLSPKVRPSETPPRPVIAATEHARTQLAQAGIPDARIVRAPYGVDPEIYTPGAAHADGPILAAVDREPRCFAGALKRLPSPAALPQIHLIGGALNRAGGEPIHQHLFGAGEQRAALYNRASMGYCGVGLESEALALAACGVPVVCPATPAGREYVIHDQTGLLFEPGNRNELAAQLARLAKDELLRRRLSVRARERAKAMSWDRTASLVLATIENL